MSGIVTAQKKEAGKCALYIRLSHEDGDKTESLSISSQRLILSEYYKKLEGYSGFIFYIDDGYTGTSYNRPAFQKMLYDIENGIVTCVIVKDLSRLGRDSSKTAQYIHEYFPEKKVRFIAINDNIDKQYYELDISKDMVIDVKNLFNSFYPRDISSKVRSSLKSKQNAGQFIGAFACYGYTKSPENHNKLLVDEPAANIVKKIFSMYLSGIGQNTIAKKLNEEEIPCPSEYKKLCGLSYHNCNRLKNTTYWTYSSIRNILRNRIYTGAMVQNKTFRQICKKKAITLPEDQWIIVPGTHEAIIDQNTFNTVQNLLSQNSRQTNLNQNIHIFAGIIKCGDCGRAMVKTIRNGKTVFTCGSYNRYGTSYCSAHKIEESVLKEIILNDFNTIFQSVKGLEDIIKKENTQKYSVEMPEIETLELEAQKLANKIENIYNDYAEGLITKEEYIKYKKHYNRQLKYTNSRLSAFKDKIKPDKNQQVQAANLLKTRCINKLERQLVVEMASAIYIYKNNTIKIIYNFSDEYDKNFKNIITT